MHRYGNFAGLPWKNRTLFGLGSYIMSPIQRMFGRIFGLRGEEDCKNTNRCELFVCWSIDPHASPLRTFQTDDKNTLPETIRSDSRWKWIYSIWKTRSFPFWVSPMFREGTVSFREGNTIRVLETKQLLPACDLLKAQQSGGWFEETHQ